MTDWAVGDKAVCVDDSPCQCGCNSSIRGLQLGQVYVVLAVRAARTDTDFTQLGIGLPPDGSHLWPDGANAARFRKVVDDKAEGEQEDWNLLFNQHRTKQPIVIEQSDHLTKEAK